MKTRQKAAVPAALVLVSLMGLAIVPLMMQRRVERLSVEMSDIADPARAAVTRLQHALSMGMAATRGFLLTGDRSYASARRKAYDNRAQAYAELASTTQQLGLRSELHRELLRMNETLVATDALVEKLFSGEISRERYVEELPRQQRDFEVVVGAAGRIDELLAEEIATRRTAIRTVDTYRILVTTLLVLMALAATLAVARLARRYREVAIQLERAADEREQLLHAERRARVESDRAREEAELRKAELERVTSSRAALIRGFSHDVRNPLGAAAGHLQLLGREVVGPLTDRQRQSVDRANRSLRAALSLIEDLLNLARAETIGVDNQSVDLRGIVCEMAEATRAQAEMKGLSVAEELPSDFPEIETDPTRVRQVLANLLSNAVKYTERGGITLRVLRRDRDGRTWAVVDVADTGHGIPEDEQARVFEEFHRLEAGQGAGGTGIGLAISQQIAATLGGRINLESTPGAGSIFSLWLPLQAAAGPSMALGA
jgi:signal transduction histidine kinase